MKRKKNIEISYGVESAVNKRGIIIVISSVLIIASIVGLFFFKGKNKNMNGTPKTTNPKEEVKSIVSKVALLFDLPTDEEPTIATVSDKTKLQDQSFFKNAENGDKVLIYTNAKKAFLYRPSTNKLIEVAPLNIQTPTGVQPTPKTIIPTVSADVSTSPPTVSIYNGTKTVGLAAETEKKLINKFPALIIGEKSNTKNDYFSNMIVDVRGNNAELAQELAVFFDAKVVTLPENETPPKSDILIILGEE